MKAILSLTALIALITACTKDSPQVQPPQKLPPGLLIKTIELIPNVVDSIITDFQYDDNARLIQWSRITNPGASFPFLTVNGMHFYRDETGRILKFSFMEEHTPDPGIDSIYYTVFYKDAPSSRVSHVIAYFRGQTGLLQYDSSLFVYETNPRPIRIYTFTSNDWPSKPAKYKSLQLRSYDASQQMFFYELDYDRFDDGNVAYLNHSNYEYDDKVNPQYDEHGDPLLLLNNLVYKHNATYIERHYYLSPIYTDSITYTYNSANKPIFATRTGARPGTIQYFYSE